jgi:hypothetical protein
MTVSLEAKIEANKNKFEVLRSIFFSRIDIREARTDSAQREMLSKMEAHHERMMVRLDSRLEKLEGCLGKTEASDLGATTEEIEPEAEHEEVAKEPQ